MSGSGAHLVTAFLAAPPTPPPGKGAEWGKAAPIGLLILVLLGVALYLLVKSMNRHMRKVSGLSSFDTAEVSTAGAGTVHPGDGSVDAGGADGAGTATTVIAGPDGRHPLTDAPPVATDPKS